MSNVVNFKTRSIEIAIKQYEDTGVIPERILVEISSVPLLCSSATKRSLDRAIEVKQTVDFIRETDEFITDYEHYIANMHTKSTAFMFPTILGRYRKGINPVHAMYHSVQESILKYDESNTIHAWILSLFDNLQWVDDLQLAIRKDVRVAEILLHRIRDNDSARIKDDKKNLTRIIENFQSYSEVFSLLEEWKKDNL